MLRLLVLSLCLVCGIAFADTDEDYVRVVRDGVLIHTGNSCIGGDIAKTLSENTTGSITVDTVVEGQKSAEINIEVDTYNDQATGNLLSISGTLEGDIIYLHTQVASQDVTVSEAGGTIFLGAATRALSDPKDVIVLKNIDGTNLVEVGYYDNN